MHTFIYKYIATYTLYIFIRGIDYMALEHTLDWGVSLRVASRRRRLVVVAAVWLPMGFNYVALDYIGLD